MNPAELKQQHEAWRQHVVHLLQTTSLSYESIARRDDVQCATGTVYKLARKHGLRRQADKAVANG